MILSELFVTLGLDLDEASFARGQLAAATIKDALYKVAEVTQRLAVGMVRAIESTLEHADAMDEASQASGVNVEALQELTYAAGFSAIGVQELTQTMGIFAKNAGAAASGSTDAANAFAKAGVSMADLASKTPDELLMQLADTFQAMPPGLKKTELALTLFGRSGKQMIPFLNDGAAGIGRLRQEARDLGIVLDENAIKASVGAADGIVKLKASFTGLLNTAIVPLIPMIVEAVTTFTRWVVVNREFLAQGLGGAFKVLGGALKLALAVLKPLVTAFALLVQYWKLAAAILGGALLAALAADVSMFWALQASAVQTGIAMVASAARSAAAWVLAAAPFLAILAVIGLIVLLAEDIWVGMHGGKSIFGLIYNWIDKIPAMLLGWFDKAIEWWMQKITAFIDWLVEIVKSVPGKIKNAAKAVISSPVLSTAVQALPGVGPALGVAIAMQKQGPEVDEGTGLPVVRHRGVGGAGTDLINAFSPPAVARPQAGGVNATLTAPTTINVTVPPGTDGEAVASHVQRAFEAMWQGKVDEFVGALGVR